MRNLSSALVVGIALMQAGCIPEYLRPFNNRRIEPAGPPPTADKLVSYLNDNASRLKSVRTPGQDISISCQYGIMPPVSLTARMECEKPRNLRLVAYHGLGGTEVDLGSNAQEFWWWIKRGDPYQYYCSYKDLEEGRVQAVMFPFQPEWIMEAMGMANYGTADQYLGVKSERNSVLLFKRTRLPQGKDGVKVIVFNRDPTKVRAGVAQVTQHQLRDEKGTLLVSADISKVQVDDVSGGVVPRVMTLHWPAAKLSMTLTFNKLVVNSPSPETVFVRSTANGNAPAVDLARIPSSALQRVQGRAPLN
jgi:hypothetical protein